MVDNQKNYYGVAPDKGKQNGPVWRYSESFAKYMSNLRANKVIRGGYGKGLTPGAGDRPQNYLNGTLGSKSALYLNNTRTLLSRGSAPLHKRASDYWLTTLGPLGIQPHAGGSNYKFYRDVVADYGADNTGESDASEAINAAVEDGNRCGLECGNTFTQGAIIYFPVSTSTSPLISRDGRLTQHSRARTKSAAPLSSYTTHSSLVIRTIHQPSRDASRSKELPSSMLIRIFPEGMLMPLTLRSQHMN